MDEKVNNTILFRCNKCNKNYASQSSLCNHNKKFHNNNNKSIISQISTNDKSNINKIKVYDCRYCNKSYNHFQSRWKHEQSCKIKNDNKIEQLEKTIIEMKNQIATILKDKGKIHPKNITKN